MNNLFNSLLRNMQGGMNPNALLSQMARSDPRAAQALQMLQGKSPDQLRTMAENMARERGISIEEIARSLGLKVPNN